MANKKAPVKVVVSIVRRDKVDYAIEILNDLGAVTIWTVLGYGVDRNGLMRLLGLRESECVVIFSIVQEEKVHRTLEALCRNLEFYKPNRGLAFTISINAISRNTLNGFMDWENIALEKLVQNQAKNIIAGQDSKVIKDIKEAELNQTLKDIKQENNTKENKEVKTENKEVKVENKEIKVEQSVVENKDSKVVSQENVVKDNVEKIQTIENKEAKK